MITKAQERQSYDTHFNYIQCLAKLMKGINILCNKNFRKADLPHKNIKWNLIELTQRSLKDEHRIVQIDNDYSYASTSWLPIKSYYLIFNILLTIEYACNLQKNIFNFGHAKCIDEFTRKLYKQEIQFSQPILNQIFEKDILFYTVLTGANLSHAARDEDMYKMALRKIAKYKEEEWKRKNNIDCRKIKDKAQHENYLNSFKVSIFDFPYYMRIRSNYRDFAFIDGVSTGETAEYFNKYFEFTALLAEALKELARKIIAQRQSDKNQRHDSKGGAE